MYWSIYMVAYSVQRDEPPAALTLIADHFNCKINVKIHHCVRPEGERERTLLL